MSILFTAGLMVSDLCTFIMFSLFRRFSVSKDETTVEKLRSIMVQLEYTYQINSWHAKGVPFKHHVYVPEVHLTTGIEFCEREDEGHVFKVSRLLLPIGYINLHTYVSSVLVCACDKVVHGIYSLSDLKKPCMIVRQG